MSALATISRLPKMQVSQLTELHMAHEYFAKNYGEAALNTSIAWRMYDQAVEDGNKEAALDCRELAECCEVVQALAWGELEQAKRNLLAMSN